MSLSYLNLITSYFDLRLQVLSVYYTFEITNGFSAENTYKLPTCSLISLLMSPMVLVALFTASYKNSLPHSIP